MSRACAQSTATAAFSYGLKKRCILSVTDQFDWVLDGFKMSKQIGCTGLSRGML